MDSTLPPSADASLTPVAVPLAVPIEPPAVVAPRAAAPPVPSAVADSDLVMRRRPRERISVFRRGLNFVKSLRPPPREPSSPSHHAQRTAAQKLVGATPPWLVSLMVHAGLMIILGLLAVKVHHDVTEEMAVAIAPDEDVSNETFAETIGEQLEAPAPGVASDDIKTGTDPTYSMSDLPDVSDPLAAAPKADDLTASGVGLLSNIEAPSIGNALEGRQEGHKKALLDSYGGTMTTQHSVDLALAWLSRQQGRDGLWSLQGPYPDGGSSENKAAATAMSLLAFLGDGHTHLKNGPHRQTVQRAIRALLKLQGPDGDFAVEGVPANHRMYTHAQCTIVVCELYAMSQDSELRDAAERAIAYSLKVQSPAGGWRYFPQQEADVSVTGWVVMALQSARMAKLEVPSEGLDRVGGFLDSASSHSGSRYAYLPGRGESPAMTAEALLCRQYLGWKHDDPRLVKGVAYVAKHPVDWEKRNVYYWYYATQVMHHMGGKPWVEWNRVMRQVIPQNQVHAGKQHGSWDPDGEQATAHSAGRLFVTCLSTYMLEVYYRHLPLYSQDALASGAPEKSSSASLQ